MKYSHIFKAAAAVLLASALAGCFDINLDVAVNDTDHATVTTTTSISKELINIDEVKAGESDFCASESDLTETETLLTCTEVHSGTFAEVFPAEKSGQSQPTIAVVGPNQVKVTFPTSDLTKEIGNAGGDDAQTKKMMQDMFAGHAITLKVSGGTITDTNMTKADDGKSAALKIDLGDLINGKVSVPDETYAVVQLP